MCPRALDVLKCTDVIFSLKFSLMSQNRSHLTGWSTREKPQDRGRYVHVSPALRFWGARLCPRGPCLVSWAGAEPRRDHSA